jgi:hypothetical protein
MVGIFRVKFFFLNKNKFKAIRFGRKDAAQLLIDEHINIDVQNHEGNTALHTALLGIKIFSVHHLKFLI